MNKKQNPSDKKLNALIVIGAAFTMAAFLICKNYSDSPGDAPSGPPIFQQSQDANTDTTALAVQTDACVKRALHSDFYRDAKHNAPQEKSAGALAAWAGTCLTQNTAPQNKEEKLLILRIAFNDITDLSDHTRDVVDEVFSQLTSGELPIAKMHSKDAAAFAILNTALQKQNDPSNQTTHKVVVPHEVKIVPPAYAGHVTLTVTQNDILKIARICQAEAGGIPTPDGVRSCAATIFNRLATGRFGNSVNEIIKTGGFEVLQGRGINNLAASEKTIALVNDVIARNLTFKGVIFFENSRVTDGRGTNFGTAVAKTGTVGDPNSWNFHDLFRGSLNLSNKAVHLYQVPPYNVVITDTPTPQERRASASVPNAGQFALN